MDICSSPFASLLPTCGAKAGKQVVKDGVQSVVTSGFDAVVKAFTDGLTTAMKALLTFWTDVPTTTVGDPNTGGAVGGVNTLIQHVTGPLMAGAAVLGLLVAGTRLALSARAGEPARNIARGLLLMVLVTAAGAGIVQVMLAAADDFTGKVLGDAGLGGAYL